MIFPSLDSLEFFVFPWPWDVLLHCLPQLASAHCQPSLFVSALYNEHESFFTSFTACTPPLHGLAFANLFNNPAPVFAPFTCSTCCALLSFGGLLSACCSTCSNNSIHFAYISILLTRIKFQWTSSCGECVGRVSVALEVFTPEWFLKAPLVDCEVLERLMKYWVFLE